MLSSKVVFVSEEKNLSFLRRRGYHISCEKKRKKCLGKDPTKSHFGRCSLSQIDRRGKMGRSRRKRQNCLEVKEASKHPKS